MSREITVKDPRTGESVVLVGVPEGMSAEQAAAAHFGTAPGNYVGRLADKVTPNPSVAKDVAKALATGIPLGIRNSAAFLAKLPAGLAIAAADAAGNTALADKFGRAAMRTEDTVDQAVKGTPFGDFADQKPTTTAGRYTKSAAAAVGGMLPTLPLGLASGASKVAPLVTKGDVALSALSGLLTQGATEAKLGPMAEVAAGLAPFLAKAGWSATFQPAASKELQAALAGTSAADLAKAKDLLKDAKDTRGIQLSIAQALGDDHPLAAVLSKLGWAEGSNAIVKPFLTAQNQPATKLMESTARFATGATGDIRGQNAANVLVKAASAARKVDEKAPTEAARALYEKSKLDLIPTEKVDAAIESLAQVLRKNAWGQDTDAGKAVLNAIGRLTPYSSSNTGMAGTPLAGLAGKPFELRAGQASAIADSVKTPFEALTKAGSGSSIKAADKAVEAVFKDLGKTDGVKAADALWEAVNQTVTQPSRENMLGFLAGQKGAQQGFEPVARLTGITDPTRFSPKELSTTLNRLNTAPLAKGQAPINAGQELVGWQLRQALDNATSSTANFAPSKFSSSLRGAPGSGKSEMLSSAIESYLKRANQLQSASDPLSVPVITKRFGQDLDILDAAGRGRGSMSSVQDYSRLGAEASPEIAATRIAAFGPIAGALGSVRSANVPKGNIALAEALTDPSMVGFNRLQAWNRPAILEAILRKAAGSLTGLELISPGDE